MFDLDGVAVVGLVESHPLVVYLLTPAEPLLSHCCWLARRPPPSSLMPGWLLRLHAQAARGATGASCSGRPRAAPPPPHWHAVRMAPLLCGWKFMRHDRWQDALFLHWPLPVALVQALLPRGLVVDDSLDGSAWLGLVLLTEEGVGPANGTARRWLPRVDHHGANVRTYVRGSEGSGVFFFSLECSSLLASMGARCCGIPYWPATMQRRTSCTGSTCEGEPPVRPGEADPTRVRVAMQMQSVRWGDGWGLTPAPWRRRRCSLDCRWRVWGGGQQPHRAEWRARSRWFLERYRLYGTHATATLGTASFPSPLHASPPEQKDECGQG
eukprot:COSAG01_NODE_1247_length_11073_cov_23.273465_17_plen_325_part_00